MSEKWRDIPGYEGIYQASSLGRVRSLDRVIEHPHTGSTRLRGKVLIQAPNGRGYLKVTLSRDNVKAQRTAHRLVLEAFVGPAPDGMECNHRNGNKTDNRLSNLHWVTASENSRHALRTGLASGKSGEDNGNAKLSPEIAEMIRKIYALNQFTMEEIGLMWGVSHQAIRDVVRGKRWANSAVD